LYTLSYGRLIQQWALWRQYLPHVQPFYAVKCNADKTILKWLAGRGSSFDCASAREMYMISELYGGRPPRDRILFANPCKTPQDIEVAKALGVSQVTVDSVEEIVKMDAANYRPEVVLRLAVDDTGSSCPFGAKFGAAPAAASEIACAAKCFDMPVVGLSFHIGSGNDRPLAYSQAIQDCQSVWEEIALKGFVDKFKVLDLGGGWSHKAEVFKEQAGAAARALQYGQRADTVIAEPGRFFAAPCYDLYVRVIGKKPKSGTGSGWRYTLDESIYGQFSCVPFDHAKPRLGRLKISMDQHTERRKSSAVLFGRTCDSLDWIANAVSMEELEVGDWLYVPEMGAYTTATSTEFNGFPKPEIIQTDLVPEAEQVNWLSGVQYPMADMLSTEKLAELR
jgi:ornithine decarboxylase